MRLRALSHKAAAVTVNDQAIGDARLRVLVLPRHSRSAFSAEQADLNGQSGTVSIRNGYVDHGFAARRRLDLQRFGRNVDDSIHAQRRRDAVADPLHQIRFCQEPERLAEVHGSELGRIDDPLGAVVGVQNVLRPHEEALGHSPQMRRGAEVIITVAGHDCQQSLQRPFDRRAELKSGVAAVECVRLDGLRLLQ